MAKINFNKLAKSARKAADAVKKHSPEILAGVGALAVVAGFADGCMQAVKADKALTEGKEKIEEIKANVTDNEEAAKEIKAVKKETAITVVKDMARPVTLVGGGTACLLGSVGILKKRTATLSAAYTALSTTFSEYRGRVVERFGEKVDKELRFGTKQETITEEVTDENGKTKTVKKKVNVQSPEDIESIKNSYVIRFDETSQFWNKHSMDYNIATAKSIQAWANTQLQLKGRLTPADIAKQLEIQPNTNMVLAGWVDDDSLDIFARDRQIKLGIDTKDPYDIVFHEPGTHKPYILLDPNVDGSVFEWYDLPREYVKFRRKSNKDINQQLADCTAAFKYGEYGEVSK